MNEGLKDKGLKRAIKEQPQFRLSTNFTFRTMQKVEEAARLHEKKIEQRTLWATIIASLLLLASGIAGVIYYLGDSLTEFIQAMLPSVLLVCHNYFLISVIRQMDEEAVFQTAFFLKEFLYTEKKDLGVFRKYKGLFGKLQGLF